MLEGETEMRDAIDMAREAGLRSAVLLQMYGKESALCDSEIEELRQIERLVKFVRADEREACAKVVEDASGTGKIISCTQAAAAIRARGNT
jgi:hypothetical protein